MVDELITPEDKPAIIFRDGKRFYVNPQHIEYYSSRYRKWVTVPKGFISDGATGAKDIYSYSWWVHDALCKRGFFDDGSPCNNWQASTILSDILRSEGRWLRAIYWWAFTWALGCEKCRENGLFHYE